MRITIAQNSSLSSAAEALLRPFHNKRMSPNEAVENSTARNFLKSLAEASAFCPVTLCYKEIVGDEIDDGLLVISHHSDEVVQTHP